MKFGEYLWTHLTPEWYCQYIDYDEMKRMLAESVAEADQLVDTNDSTRRVQFFLQADEQFFRFCEKHASNINIFFDEKLTEALRLFEPLKTELQNIDQANRIRYVTNSHMISMDHTEVSHERSNEENRPLLTSTERPNAFKAWLSRLKPEKSIEIMRKIRIERIQDRKIDDLKMAFSELYLMLILLRNYQTLNSTGFRKILKKHDKLFQTTRGDEWREIHIESAPFHTSRRVDELIKEVETLYTNVLESGNRTAAMQRLRVPSLEEKQSYMVAFRVGVFVGMLCLLIPLVVILSQTFHVSRSNKPLEWRSAIHLYRPTFLIILQIILLSINMYGWSRSGVNHILIFEIDPRSHLTYQKLLEIGTFLMTVWFLSFITFIISSYYDVQPFAQPLGLTIFFVLLLINPTRTFYYSSRRWLLKNLLRVVLSPWYHVNFTAFWLGDQLTSLELIFFDVHHFVCFYSYDINWTHSKIDSGIFCGGWTQYLFQTLFILLPSWFRFAQCLRRYRETKCKFPHLVNAGKYASGFLVAISDALRRVNIHDYQHYPMSNPFLYLWIGVSLFSSTYKLMWDLKMDWGLLKDNLRHKYLREQLVYQCKIYYYVAIIVNLLFRYCWMIHIFFSLRTTTGEYSDIIGFAFGIVELIRRFIWNFFRLENEHLNNCCEDRVIRDISIPSTTEYAKRLELFSTPSNVEQQHNAKQRQLIATEKRMTKTARKRKTVMMNSESDHRTISSGISTTTRSMDKESKRRMKSTASNSLLFVNNSSSSDPLIVIKSYRS